MIALLETNEETIDYRIYAGLTMLVVFTWSEQRRQFPITMDCQLPDFLRMNIDHPVDLHIHVHYESVADCFLHRRTH